MNREEEAESEGFVVQIQMRWIWGLMTENQLIS